MSDQQHIDKQHIDQVLAGNTDVFAEIVNAYKNQVAGVCFNMLKDAHLAEEVGQETFIRLFKSLAQYNYKSTLGTYITRIAINLSLNKLDSIKRRQNRFQEQTKTHHSFVANEDRADVKMENAELVQLALNSLKPEARSVVVLRMIEGYSVTETSEILGIAEGTVMSKLNRAMKKMKETLNRNEKNNG